MSFQIISSINYGSSEEIAVVVAHYTFFSSVYRTVPPNNPCMLCGLNYEMANTFAVIAWQLDCVAQRSQSISIDRRAACSIPCPKLQISHAVSFKLF